MSDASAVTLEKYKTRTNEYQGFIYREHYLGDRLTMRQPFWREQDRWKQIDPVHIEKTDRGCHGDWPKLGNTFLSYTCNKPQRWGSSYFIQKEQRTSEPILLLLPCNNGVVSGNYFKGGQDRNGHGNTWRSFDLKYRDIRDQFCMAAIDCLIYCSDVERSKMPGYRDGKGCIVFEWEMERVRSEVDEGIPDQSSFRIHAGQNLAKKRGDVLELAEHIKPGLERVFNEYKFEVIFAHLAPVVYRMAFAKAVEDLKLWDRVCLLDFRTMLTGVVARSLFRYWYINGRQERGILDVRYLHKLARADFIEKCYEDCRFWDYSCYQKNWEPQIYDVEFKGPMITSRQAIRAVDWAQPIENVRWWYNVPPNLQLHSAEPVWGDALKKFHQFD